MLIMTKLPDETKSLIDGKNIAHVATLKKDGSPHVTPVWIDRIDNNILINTTENRLKFKNLKNDKRIAVSITDFNNVYQWTSIIGEVINMTNDGADEHIDKLSKKYLGVPKYPYRQDGEIRTIIEIVPKSVTHS